MATTVAAYGKVKAKAPAGTRPAGTLGPDLRQWLDLASLGAVCDVTQLVGFNRAIAAQGLKVMSAWSNPGLKALMAAAKAELKPATAFHAGRAACARAMASSVSSIDADGTLATTSSVDRWRTGPRSPAASCWPSAVRSSGSDRRRSRWPPAARGRPERYSAPAHSR